MAGTPSNPPAITAAIASINGNLVAYGATLEVTNTSGAPVDILIIDPGRTPAGNPADQAPEQIAAGTTEYFRLVDQHVDRQTNKIAVTFQPTDGVNAQVIY